MNGLPRDRFLRQALLDVLDNVSGSVVSAKIWNEPMQAINIYLKVYVRLPNTVNLWIIYSTFQFKFYQVLN